MKSDRKKKRRDMEICGTADNNPEFAHLAQNLPDIPIFFAHLYSAWAHGTNENQNDPLRRFFPKGRFLSAVSEDAIPRAQNWINRLPRKLFRSALLTLPS